MTSTGTQNADPALQEQFRVALDAELCAALDRAPGAGPALLRFSIPVADLDPYAWLDAQLGSPRTLWEGREGRSVRAGVGAAHTLHCTEPTDRGAVLDACRCVLGDTSDARFYGGFSFRPVHAEPGPWEPFGTAWFVLPRFELVKTPSETALFCNVVLDKGVLDKEALLHAFDALRWSPVAPAALPAISDRVDSPARTEWGAMIEDALGLIQNETLEKIVLARKARYSFGGVVDGPQLLRRLKRVTSTCFHFCFEPAPGLAFMGTTPERLFARAERSVLSEVLAGTRARSRDLDEDARLSDALLSSEKDQREHDIVRKSIRQRLHLLCEALEVADEASLLKLERKQHLYSAVSGTLRAAVSDAALLDALHPTPAVGGYPADVALAEIERLEPFRRGWYAAPVGWIASDACEFAVAIRSGLVVGQDVFIYSGAGIVAGSTAEEEWREIENKISDFVKVTGPA